MGHPPTRDDVVDVAARTAAKLDRVLARHGRSLEPGTDDDAEDPLAGEHPALASCYAASAQGVALSGDRAGQPLLRLVVSRSPSRGNAPDALEPVAEVRGVSIHARQRVHGRDRAGLERLARYVTRPPVAQDRLTLLPDGRVHLALKSPWKDGTSAILLEPFDLAARLCASVPPSTSATTPSTTTSPHASRGRGCSDTCSSTRSPSATAVAARCDGGG